MPAKKTQSQEDQSKNSSALLLAEHARISALYQHNAEMGDKYVTTYLTTMSITIALLVGINKFGTNTQESISIELALLATLLSVGVTIFRRLMDRRLSMIEYLRAINRIHHYFAIKDKEMASHLYWSPTDDEPHVRTKGTFLGGLRDIVILLNSFSMGIGVYLIAHLLNPAIDLFKSIVLSVLSGIIVLVVLEIYGRILLQRAHNNFKNKIHFPKESKT